MARTAKAAPRGASAVANLEWDDLRVLLAICRAGSLVAAARALGHDHSTLFRKLNRIEERAGVRFFERLASGYAMTDAGEIALRFGERIEGEFHALGREIDGRDARLSGTVRVTAPDGVCTVLLPPVLADFRRRHPGVKVELLEGTDALDLSRREADVAIRATRAPPDDSLAKRVCDFRFATYAAPTYLRAAGRRPLAEHDWVLVARAIGWLVPSVWKTRASADARVVMRTNSTTAALAAARAGVGLTVLPCYRGDADAGLVRAGPTLDFLDMTLWIMTHPVLRHTARVRVLMTFVADALTEHAALFAGEHAAAPRRSRARR